MSWALGSKSGARILSSFVSSIGVVGCGFGFLKRVGKFLICTSFLNFCPSGFWKGQKLVKQSHLNELKKEAKINCAQRSISSTSKIRCGRHVVIPQIGITNIFSIM